MAFVETGRDPAIEELFKSYAQGSSHVKYQMIDPDKSPELAQKYNITTYGTIRVGYGDQSTLVSKGDEEAVTNAIIKVTHSTKKTVCLIEGHGEPDAADVESPKAYGGFRTALESENYIIKAVLLASQEKMPDECNLVVVPAPVKPYLEPELKHLKDYLQRRRPRGLPPRRAARARAGPAARRLRHSRRRRHRRRPGAAAVPGARARGRADRAELRPAPDHRGLHAAHDLPVHALGGRRRGQEARHRGHLARQDEPVELGGDRPRRAVRQGPSRARPQDRSQGADLGGRGGHGRRPSRETRTSPRASSRSAATSSSTTSSSTTSTTAIS